MWVLTGDKEETAINIAVACNLVLPTEYMQQVIINKNTAADLDKAKAIFQYEIKVRRLTDVLSSVCLFACFFKGYSLNHALLLFVPHSNTLSTPRSQNGSPALSLSVRLTPYYA